MLNAGVPRSGTVLVNAILRRLFEHAGIPVLQANPHGAELSRLVRHLQATGQDRHRTVLVHTHSWDRATAEMLAGSPHVTAFANFRDPRDVAVSLMRLHDHDFATAADMTVQSFRIFEAMRAATAVMEIPYELLAADRRGHIFHIARRLGLWPGLDAVARIDEETSIDRHRAVMERVRDGTLEGLTRRNNRNRVLSEDPRTLINDRHIQSGACGRWKTELSEAERGEAARLFAPILARYGYTA